MEKYRCLPICLKRNRDLPETKSLALSKIPRFPASPSSAKVSRQNSSLDQSSSLKKTNLLSEDGEAQIFTIFFLLLTSAIVIFLITELFMTFHRQKSRLRFDSCVAQYIEFHRKEVNRLQQTNSIVEKMYLLELALKTTPATVAAAEATRTARLVLERQQFVSYVSFLKNSYQSPIKECQRVKIILEPIYQVSGIDLKRSMTRYGILRRSNWTIIFNQKNYIARANINTPNAKSKIKFSKEILVAINRDLILSN